MNFKITIHRITHKYINEIIVAKNTANPSMI
jgi:hypothetical protein